MTGATISKKAVLGPDVHVGVGAIIHDNVEIGAGSVIDSYCVLGYPAPREHAGQRLRIGPGAIIRSHSILYEGSEFGAGLRIGHHALVREGVSAGVGFQIGSFCDLEGLTRIGDWVRFHSSVHVGRGTQIDDFALLFPYVVTTNDPAPPSGLMVGSSIGAAAVVATSAVVLPGTRVGEGAFIGAMTRAGGEIPAGALFVGNPGRLVGSVRRIKYEAAGIMHPWPRHQTEAYPPEALPQLKALLARIEEGCDQLEKGLDAG